MIGGRVRRYVIAHISGYLTLSSLSKSIGNCNSAGDLAPDLLVSPSPDRPLRLEWVDIKLPAAGEDWPRW